MTTEEFKTKLELFQTEINEKKASLAEVLTQQEAATDEDAKSSLEAKMIELIGEIESLEAVAQKEYNKYKAVKPLAFDLKSNSNDGEKLDLSKLEEMFNNLQIKTDLGDLTKKSPGQYVADYLDSLNVKSADDFDRVFSNVTVPFYFTLDSKDLAAVAEVSAAKSIKSLYTNNGTQLVVSGNPVPGFQGYGCTIFEVSDECQVCIEPRNFTDLLTVRNMPTGNTIQYDYPVSRDDNASGVLETIYNPYPTVVQNGRKPESVFTYNTAKVSVSKIAHFITASDEVLDDCGKVADRLDFHLTTGLIVERDRQLIAGTGTAGEVLGLLNQPGILALNGNTLTTGVDTPNIWDKLYLAKLELEQNCARVDGVIVNPADRAKVALAKDANGNYLFPQGTNCEVESVGCLILKISPDVPVGTAIIGEFRNNWVWYARKNLTIKVGMTGDQMIYNTKTFLAELRGAVVVFCPNKIAIVTNI